jgi:hypothetical protein
MLCPASVLGDDASDQTLAFPPTLLTMPLEVSAFNAPPRPSARPVLSAAEGHIALPFGLCSGRLQAGVVLLEVTCRRSTIRPSVTKIMSNIYGGSPALPRFFVGALLAAPASRQPRPRLSSGFGPCSKLSSRARPPAGRRGICCLLCPPAGRVAIVPRFSRNTYHVTADSTYVHRRSCPKGIATLTKVWERRSKIPRDLQLGRLFW